MSGLDPLPAGATIGILGGGQLGRYTAIAAQQRGYRVAILDPEPDAPAQQIAHVRLAAAYDDPEALDELARIASVVTLEFENVPAAAVRRLEQAGVPVRPGSDILAITQNRIEEKRFLTGRGFPVAPHRPILTAEDAAAGFDALGGGPAILKTAECGYDGKGQTRVDSAAASRDAFQRFGSAPCVLEGMVPFAWECSVLVARDLSGRSETFPVCENVHSRHILDYTVCPARIPSRAAEATEGIARAVAESLGYVGLLAIEFFVLEDGEVVINELAPRPHNSGHLTIDAALHSQFEQQLRCAAGWPVLPARLVHPGAAMANILGDLWENGEPRWERLADFPEVRLHLYGKAAARPGRKMGHLNAWGGTADEALARVLSAREALAR